MTAGHPECNGKYQRNTFESDISSISALTMQICTCLCIHLSPNLPLVKSSPFSSIVHRQLSHTHPSHTPDVILLSFWFSHSIPSSFLVSVYISFMSPFNFSLFSPVDSLPFSPLIFPPFILLHSYHSYLMPLPLFLLLRNESLSSSV